MIYSSIASKKNKTPLITTCRTVVEKISVPVIQEKFIYLKLHFIYSGHKEKIFECYI